MRHNPSTVVVLAGQSSAGLLAAISRLMNVSLVRPAETEGAASALHRAARISSPYVVVAADPLAAVAAQWQAMWEISDEPRGSEAFELEAAQAVASWRAGQFELPDYYLVLAAPGAAPGAPPTAAPAPDFHLGPLRGLRPHRVAVVAASETAEQVAGVHTALGSLRHGRWWPPLPEVVDAARHFYPGSLSPIPNGTAVPASPGRDRVSGEIGTRFSQDS
ncbi:MAG TPA: hypothetical protein VI365_11675 [Trebonia sp.]